MGGALARAVARAEGEIYVCDVCEEKARALAAEVGGRTASDREIAAECDFIFLAVKPNTVAAVLCSSVWRRAWLSKILKSWSVRGYPC